MYTEGSTDGDIAKSCKDLSVGLSTGVLSATCNKAVSDTGDDSTPATGTVTTSATTLDLDDVIHCPVVKNSDGLASSVLAWGTALSTPGDWQLSVSSLGADYIVEAKCTTATGCVFGGSKLDLGDTTNGLKNDAGSLAKR